MKGERRADLIKRLEALDARADSAGWPYDEIRGLYTREVPLSLLDEILAFLVDADRPKKRGRPRGAKRLAEFARRAAAFVEQGNDIDAVIGKATTSGKLDDIARRDLRIMVNMILREGGVSVADRHARPRPRWHKHPLSGFVRPDDDEIK